MTEAEFVPSGFEAVFDAPAAAFHPDQRSHGRALGAPGKKEGEFAVADVATDEQATGPPRVIRLLIVSVIEVGQFQITLVMQAWSSHAVAMASTVPPARGILAQELNRCAELTPST